MQSLNQLGRQNSSKWGQEQSRGTAEKSYWCWEREQKIMGSAWWVWKKFRCPWKLWKKGKPCVWKNSWRKRNWNWWCSDPIDLENKIQNVEKIKFDACHRIGKKNDKNDRPIMVTLIVVLIETLFGNPDPISKDQISLWKKTCHHVLKKLAACCSL